MYPLPDFKKIIFQQKKLKTLQKKKKLNIFQKKLCIQNSIYNVYKM